MTSISILGAGSMGRAIGTRMVSGGQSVQILDHEPDRASALAASLGDSATSGSTTEKPTGDVVVLAVPYRAALTLVTDYGGALGGKIVVDITNPVDFATFDGLVTPDDSSAAEEIAKAGTDKASVVKAFNTTFAATLVAGQVAGSPLDVLIAGDDDSAKQKVSELVKDAELHPIDAGPLRRARQLEHAGLLHMALQQSLGTNFASAIRFVS